MPMMVPNMALSMAFIFDARQGAPPGRRMEGSWKWHQVRPMKSSAV
jgi:hypothetical protein